MVYMYCIWHSYRSQHLYILFHVLQWFIILVYRLDLLNWSKYSLVGLFTYTCLLRYSWLQGIYKIAIENQPFHKINWASNTVYSSYGVNVLSSVWVCANIYTKYIVWYLALWEAANSLFSWASLRASCFCCLFSCDSSMSAALASATRRLSHSLSRALSCSSWIYEWNIKLNNEW